MINELASTNKISCSDDDRVNDDGCTSAIQLAYSQGAVDPVVEVSSSRSSAFPQPAVDDGMIVVVESDQDEERVYAPAASSSASCQQQQQQQSIDRRNVASRRDHCFVRVDQLDYEQQQKQQQQQSRQSVSSDAAKLKKFTKR